MTLELEPLEWIEQVFGTGDGATQLFGGHALAWPIVRGTLTVEPKPTSLEVVESEGNIQLGYVPAPPQGTRVTVRYAWRPPALRGALVRVKLSSGLERWATLDELTDGIQRNFMSHHGGKVIDGPQELPKAAPRVVHIDQAQSPG